ncbi:MAG: hypothetical protein RLP96_00115 [Alphaproteobacteria bacterium]
MKEPARRKKTPAERRTVRPVPAATPAARRAAAQAVSVELAGAVMTVAGDLPRALVVTADDGLDRLPDGPLNPHEHKTLDRGLRALVEDQTGLRLGHVEQLYTFGDRFRTAGEHSGGARTVAVGYVALARQSALAAQSAARWQSWYDYLPWEDWRAERPPVLDQVIAPALREWAGEATTAAGRRERDERLSIAFAIDGGSWDPERVLERYELLYEARLIAEARRDAASPGEPARAEPSAAHQTGQAMHGDNRRILATAIGRLRGKAKYRPVIFELLPETFTLLALQQAVEAIAGVRLHKQNFRRLVLNGGLVETTGRQARQDAAGKGGRPAALFRFRREVLRERTATGVGIPILRPPGG